MRERHSAEALAGRCKPGQARVAGLGLRTQGYYCSRSSLTINAILSAYASINAWTRGSNVTSVPAMPSIDAATRIGA